MYSTENYIEYPVINHNGKEYKKEHTHVYNWVTLLYSRDWHKIVNQLYVNKLKKSLAKEILQNICYKNRVLSLIGLALFGVGYFLF